MAEQKKQEIQKKGEEPDQEITPYRRLESMVRSRSAEVTQLLPGTFGDAKSKNEAVARFCRQLMTAVERNPKLYDVNQDSLWLAGLNIASVGLDPSGVTGEAAIVPFAGVCTPMIMVRGYIALAIRSGAALAIDHNVVCENDKFDYEFGSAAYIRHRPALTARGNPIAVWAIATLPSGEKVYEIMGWEAVMAIKARSKTASSGPWVTDPLEMGRKTVVRRIVKRLPWNSDSSVVERLYGLQEQEDATFGVGDVSGRGEIADQPQTAPKSGAAALKSRMIPQAAPETARQGTEAAKPGTLSGSPENAPQTDPAEFCAVCGHHEPGLRGQMSQGCPECKGVAPVQDKGFDEP